VSPRNGTHHDEHEASERGRSSTPEDFAAFVKDESEREPALADIIRTAPRRDGGDPSC
jgi:hypothetical protein